LQVVVVARAAFGLRNDVIHLGCQSHATDALAWLAEVTIPDQDALALLNPGCVIPALMARATIVVPWLAGQ
jgi:hypothetical protein